MILRTVPGIISKIVVFARVLARGQGIRILGQRRTDVGVVVGFGGVFVGVVASVCGVAGVAVVVGVAVIAIIEVAVVRMRKGS